MATNSATGGPLSASPKLHDSDLEKDVSDRSVSDDYAPADGAVESTPEAPAATPGPAATDDGAGHGTHPERSRGQVAVIMLAMSVWSPSPPARL